MVKFRRRGPIKPDSHQARSSDDHEHAVRGGLPMSLEMDAVGPDVDGAAGREIPAPPALVLRLPPGREARDRAWRQGRPIGTEDRRQRLLEITAGQAARI